MNLLTKLLALTIVTVVGVIPLSVQAALLLEVDLSVPDTITITSTTNASDATVGGSDTIGFYLDGFFAPGSNSTSHTLISGDLTSASELSDGSPSLFRSGSTDQGLNVWSYTNDPTSNFTAGSQAFTGSATWTVGSGAFTDGLNGSLGGDIYFPADDLGDLPSAILIGTWAVVALPAAAEPIPSLSTWALLLLALMLTVVGFRSLRH